MHTGKENKGLNRKKQRLTWFFRAVFVILCVSSFFTVLFVYLVRQSTMEKNVVTLAQIRSSITKETKRKSDLKLTAAEKLDIASVRKKASEKLQMIYPVSEQIIFVQLPEPCVTR